MASRTKQQAAAPTPRPGGVGGVPPRLADKAVTPPRPLAAAAAAAAPRLAVVACMDPRLRLEAALGVSAGQATFIRNAGGVLTEDTLQALLTAHRAFGVREFVLVGHDDCALAPNGSNAGAFVTAQMERLRGWSALPSGVTVRGFVYSVAAGRVVEVGVAAPASVSPASNSASVTAAAVAAPQTEPQPARRINGKLQRERLDRIPLEKVPPAPSSMAIKSPTTEDFRRKVETMVAGETPGLRALDSAEPAASSENRNTGMAASARELLRAIILGEALGSRPRAARPRGGVR